MLQNLNTVVDDVAALKSKLVLLVGGRGSGKTDLLRSLAQQRQAEVLYLGATLSPRLAPLPQRKRTSQITAIFRELVREHARGGPLYVDTIEVLFDRGLHLDPLELLKRLANASPVVAVWPGDIHNGRLRYAETGHPEHKSYSIEGFVPFELETATE